MRSVKFGTTIDSHIYFALISLLSLKFRGIKKDLCDYKRPIHTYLTKCSSILICTNFTRLSFATLSTLCYQLAAFAISYLHILLPTTTYIPTYIYRMVCCCICFANISTSINFRQMTIEFCDCGCQKCHGLSQTLSSAMEFS